MNTSRQLVTPGTEVRLADWDPTDTDDFDGDKAEARAHVTEHGERLDELQQVLFAENKHKVLVVLQGMDSSGKDGTVRHVFRQVNPVGVDVANFKKPTEVELAHDYLWRVHQHAPRTGEITIFNRSHYEDVLVVRVHNLVQPDVWIRRYDHINDFERMLADEGCTILKFFLHISKDEQRDRLQARVDNPRKQWKFEHGDLDERKRWDDYMDAYDAVLTRTSTEWAPWYVVPSDHKWYRNLFVSTVLVERIEALDPRYPEPPDGIEDLTIE